jgi:hypothetical protein
MARTGLRMMPTFPSPSLKFRTAGFPQYGFKASLSGGAFPSAPTCCAARFASVLRTRSLRTRVAPVGAIRVLCPGSSAASWCRCSRGLSLCPRGPRSGPGCSVPVHLRLLGPIRPTRRHTATSSLCDLYAVSSLCVPASATHEWFRAFTVRSFPACRPLRPRGVRRLLAPSSFIDDAGLRLPERGSALPNFSSSVSDEVPVSRLNRFAFATACRVACLPDGSDRALSEGGYPLSFTLLGGSPSSFAKPTETFTPGLPASRSPFSPPGMTTVATGQFPPAGLSPARTSASIAALQVQGQVPT